MRQAARQRGVLAVVERLRERRGEIEQASLSRVYAIADPIEAADPQYAEGLRSAVSAALDYGFAAIEAVGSDAPPIPVSLLAQARLAARSGVNLDTVLRRYFAGYTLFGDFLVQEAEGEEDLGSGELKRLLRTEAVFFDRLLVAVSDEYAREAKSRPGGSRQRRAEAVKRLLHEGPVDATSLNYELEATHLGIAAAGEGAEETIGEIARSLDRRLLLVPGAGETIWAWLGGRVAADPDRLLRAAAACLPAQVVLALGEPGEGVVGWRLTHRQAKAALPIALRGKKPIARYRDVALLASTLQDELLVTSLRRLYVEPLEAERDGGQTLRETLHAYFEAERNVSSAAVALGVSRQAVAKRLYSIERRLGVPLSARGLEIMVALRLEELGTSAQAS